MNSPKKMSLMVFDDIFFIYDPVSDNIDSKSILELNSFLRINSLSSPQFEITLFQDLPYVMVPELMYHEGENQILFNHKYPHLIPSVESLRVDTWPLHFTKCVYYIPSSLRHHQVQVWHLYSVLCMWSERFFSKYSNGLWTFKIQNKVVAFLRLANHLKEVRTFEAGTADEASFHLLKLLEPYKEHQNEMNLWTNESDPYYLQIMSKYIPRITVEKNDVKFLIKDILVASCASLQEI
mgnify:CR=1 FL=1